MPNMLKKYNEEVLPALKAKFGYTNNLQVPRLKKIVINTGVNSNTTEKDTFKEAKQHIAMITGQAPVITKSTKNIANFKLRAGMPVGVMVTLRGSKMYDFIDRLVHNALPRVRDFRGIPKKGFDKVGNYNLGVPDVTIFTEVDLDKVKYPLGLNITMVTTAKNDQEAKALLTMMEMPFAE
ncbi:MAG: 50S ribosomal protein L5 [Lentisphaerae bacterium GWF2_44_16]|nr:MAG: 50S ribosomal protein L5 [Lentisphaerae bacterium GWF2_44_16]